jgi:hypothetical protein
MEVAEDSASIMARSGLQEWDSDGLTAEREPRANQRSLQRAIPVVVGSNPAC